MLLGAIEEERVRGAISRGVHMFVGLSHAEAGARSGVLSNPPVLGKINVQVLNRSDKPLSERSDPVTLVFFGL